MIVVVGSSGLGRVGTTLTMGIMKKLGFNLGGLKTRLSPRNELHIYQEMLKNALPNSWPGLDVTPSIAVLESIKTKHHDHFRDIFNSEFQRKFPVAIKDARLLILPFLYRLREYYDVRVILLHRDPNDQTHSIVKANEGYTDQPFEYFFDRIWAWRDFVDRARAYYDYAEYTEIYFEDLIQSPRQTILKICEFVGIDPSVGKLEELAQMVKPEKAHIGVDR
jgi:hypothetical protein